MLRRHILQRTIEYTKGTVILGSQVEFLIVEIPSRSLLKRLGVTRVGKLE